MLVIVLCHARFNEAAGFTRRKRRELECPVAVELQVASMRPPDLPGGNNSKADRGATYSLRASMRPPDLPGGNRRSNRATRLDFSRCFNEAAGFTRRKRGLDT